MRRTLVVLLVSVIGWTLLPNPIAHSAPSQQGGYPVLPECEAAPTEPICIVVVDWDAAEVATYTEPVTLEGDEFTFVYEDAAPDMVLLSGGISTLIYPVSRSDYWAIRIHVENASAAVFTYSFIPIKANRPLQPKADPQVWRGPDAPPLPATSDPLQGTVETVEFDSAALGTTRTVEVYVPPNHDVTVPTKVVYMTDGYFVTDYAPIVEALIVAGDIPPVLLVGAYPGVDPTRQRDVRGDEYLPGRNKAVFDKHAQFFLEELIPWAETTYGASSDRADRAIFGLSNGSAFSSYMGINHPEIFGAAIVFSQAWQVDFKAPVEGLPVRYYFEVGTLEPAFYAETNRWMGVLADAGVEVAYHERVAGHDTAQWQEEIGHALLWVFGSGE